METPRERWVAHSGTRLNTTEKCVQKPAREAKVSRDVGWALTDARCKVPDQMQGANV